MIIEFFFIIYILVNLAVNELGNVAVPLLPWTDALIYFNGIFDRFEIRFWCNQSNSITLIVFFLFLFFWD